MLTTSNYPSIMKILLLKKQQCDRPLKTEHTAKRIKKGGRQHLTVKSETLKRDIKISSMFYFELYQTLLWRV